MTTPIRRTERALPAPRTRADDVIRYVEELVDARDLKPGDLIGTRADLRDQTGVARATINEAIRLLQDRGSVSLRPGPGGGLFVAAPHPVVTLGRTLLAVDGDPSLTAGAIEMREQLEPLIAAHAAQHRTRTDSKELKVLLRDLVRGRTDPVAFSANMVRLHVRVAEISPNAVLKASYISLYEYVGRTSAIEVMPSADYVDARLQIHQELIDAIVAGDVAAAQRAAVAHSHRAPSTG